MSIPQRILVPLDFSKPSMNGGLYMALPQNLLDDFEREARARLDQTLTPRSERPSRSRAS